MKPGSTFIDPTEHPLLKDKEIWILMRKRVLKDYISFFFLSSQTWGTLSKNLSDLWNKINIDILLIWIFLWIWSLPRTPKSHSWARMLSGNTLPLSGNKFSLIRPSSQAIFNLHCSLLYHCIIEDKITECSSCKEPQRLGNRTPTFQKNKGG